jgi:hypothetical protein
VFFSLPRVFYLALGKEASVPSVLSVPRVFYLALGKEASVPSVFSVPRVFYFALGKEASVPSVFSVPRVFYFALGKAFFAESFLFSSRHRNELWAKPRIPVVSTLMVSSSPSLDLRF